jgi:1-acyl-sn-glycerol-3-phosphate acyltransferase
MLKEVCTLLFKASGWIFKNSIPQDLKSFILVGAPHTSNHDFIPAMAIAKLINRSPRFAIKDEWMKFPFNLVMKPAGAIGIDRSKMKEGSQTDVMAQLFKDNPELVLMIAPEGTRRPSPNWKTGFYYIAQKANVPIVLGYADFKKKEAGTGPIIYPKNFEEDMKAIMKFYEGIHAKKPENFVPDTRFRTS